MSKETKAENLQKMIRDLEIKIEKLNAQKKLYELSLQQLKKEQ